MSGYKIFISADIEGVASVVGTNQTMLGEPQHEAARKWMTEEVNAAIEGAKEAGAAEFVVCDSHAYMENLIPDLLHEDALLVRGAMRESLQMQGIDRSFDGLFVTGSHAAAGTVGGVLDHTWVGRSVYNLRINGDTLNEACLNAIVAGYYGAKFLLVTGDQATIDQTREFHPEVGGAVVKRSFSRWSSESLHPNRAKEVIRKAAYEAVKGIESAPTPVVPDELEMEIDFLRTDMADAAALVPGVKRLGARTISYTGDPETIFRLQQLILYRLQYE